MKRSPMKPGTKPMSRGQPMSRGSGMQRASKPMKSRGPKMTPIRKSAKGEECTMMIPGVCNRDPATVVLAHSNELAAGKGMGLKAPDIEACYSCSCCHDVLDGRRPLPGWMSRHALLGCFERAKTITHERLKEKGLIP